MSLLLQKILRRAAACGGRDALLLTESGIVMGLSSVRLIHRRGIKQAGNKREYGRIRVLDVTIEDQNAPHSARHAWSWRMLAGLCLAWVFILAFFHSFPAADIAFSSLFCQAKDAAADGCNLFPARNHWLTGAFRPLFYWVPVGALVVMVTDIAWQYARNRWADRDRMRGEVLALAAYLVGPILIVNGLLKAYSGRPRPVDATLFGGNLDFVAAGDLSGACMSNCSFVSGEAAAAGWLLCLIPLLRGRFRHIVAALVIDVSLAAPFLRVVMGSHFLSDAILGWLIGAMSLPALFALHAAFPRGISATLDRLR
jgi:lipid A 4'-phosphatase